MIALLKDSPKEITKALEGKALETLGLSWRWRAQLIGRRKAFVSAIALLSLPVPLVL